MAQSLRRRRHPVRARSYRPAHETCQSAHISHQQAHDSHQQAHKSCRPIRIDQHRFRVTVSARPPCNGSRVTVSARLKCNGSRVTVSARLPCNGSRVTVSAHLYTEALVPQLVVQAGPRQREGPDVPALALISSYTHTITLWCAHTHHSTHTHIYTRTFTSNTPAP